MRVNFLYAMFRNGQFLKRFAGKKSGGPCALLALYAAWENTAVLHGEGKGGDRDRAREEGPWADLPQQHSLPRSAGEMK